ncbi:hypothetical protein BRC72_00070 [Halobacteriales archaeon QH_7_66_36]|nr:MAG: hypothetical protein BRC72_00070 [Halobacteriales archaeon QH_7_66_36]
MRDSGTPINASEETALDHLEQYVDALPDDEDPVAHLMDLGSERTDARAHVEQLLSKGYLYEVDDELRIPPRP